MFTADANGKAEFVHSFRPGLQLSDVWTTSMLAINYHSDGKTYGGLTRQAFGLNAHIPLFVMLPKQRWPRVTTPTHGAEPLGEAPNVRLSQP